MHIFFDLNSCYILTVHLLSPHSDVFLFLKGKPLEDAPKALITSLSDLDNHMRRVVSKILSCKNQPTELTPLAMAQQLKEAQV